MLNMRLAFLIIFLHGQAWSAIAEYVPSADCDNLSDCASERPNPVCALDREVVCYRSFDSLCHLKNVQCKKQIVFPIFPNEYCENSPYKCKD